MCSAHLIIGVAAGFWEIDQRKSPTALFLVTGFLRWLHHLLHFQFANARTHPKNDWTKAGANIAASVALCLLCTWAGWMLGQSLRKTTVKFERQAQMPGFLASCLAVQPYFLARLQPHRYIAVTPV